MMILAPVLFIIQGLFTFLFRHINIRLDHLTVIEEMVGEVNISHVIHSRLACEPGKDQYGFISDLTVPFGPENRGRAPALTGEPEFLFIRCDSGPAFHGFRVNGCNVHGI